MVAVAPLLASVWPRARFIFLRRRGAENIVSRLSRFPGTSFRAHCRDGAEAMQGWRAVRETLGSAALEFDQLELAEAPVRSAERVAALFDLPADATTRLSHALANERPERTAARFPARLDVGEAGWSQAQIDYFNRTCAPMMAAYGYG